MKTLELLINQFFDQVEDKEDLACNVSHYVLEAEDYLEEHAKSVKYEQGEIESLLDDLCEGILNDET